MRKALTCQIDRALYLTVAMTGLRQGELVALRWRDAGWTAGRIRVRQNYVLGEFGTPKSRHSTRSVPMADALVGELDRLHQTSRGRPPRVRQPRTRMAGAGTPMRTLQEWMGHRDIETTQRYADYAPSPHDIPSISDRLHPGSGTAP